MTASSNNDNGDTRRIVFLILLSVALVWAMVSLSSCRSKKPLVVTPKPEIHYIHDTVKTVERHDSIVNHYIEKKDSSSFRQNGDTVRIEHWHWERDYSHEKVLEAKIDSISHAKRDSIPYPVPYEVSVPAEIKKWQRGLMWWGGTSILLLILWLVMKIKTGR